MPPRLLLLALAAPALPALAHEAGLSGGNPWRTRAWALALLAAGGAAYAAGVRAAWRRAGRGRGIAVAPVLLFALGWLSTLAAIAPPLDALADRRFSMHMVQHELLMVVAAPLLVLGRPFVAWSWAWPAAARAVRRGFARPALGRPWRAATSATGAWLLHAAALWAWHVPAFFQAALARPLLHELQHLSFFGAALLFWWSVLGRSSLPGQAAAALSLFTTLIHTGVLGALLTLSSRVWYAAYLPAAQALGIDALADQQLGGVLMWVPAGAAYLAAALAITVRILGTGSAGPASLRG